MANFRRRFIIGGTLVALAGTLAACGHGWSHRTPEEKAQWVVEKVTKKLELNQNQIEKLDGLKTELLASRKP